MPSSAESLKGIYMLEPYEPQKIPVLMVHGLWSSPVTWMEMFNDLRSFPELREQYQFWFYLYPTGQPFWVSSSQLREHLAEARMALDPDRSSPWLDQMVLIGHSMGGLVAKMQTLDSGEDFWNILSERPFEELKVDHETRDRLARTVFFQPNPSVRRVVTIGTPHHGSEFANDYTRWLGRQLIRLPDMMVQATQRIHRDNPGFFRDREFLTCKTSIDSLSPDSPVLPVVRTAQKSPRTDYHNIVGVSEEDGIMVRLTGTGDGVVDYDSAHLDDVDSEITVGADHMNVHRHPRSILEVRRILREHRVAALAEVHSRPNTRQVSFQNSAGAGQSPGSEEQERALAAAREYLGHPADAQYHVLPHTEGHGVLVRRTGALADVESHAPRASELLLVISPEGRVIRVVPGS
jgi:pimeloyl-ACP methyl ester carboxylesterase